MVVKSIDDMIIEKRMSELIFKRGMLLDIFHSFRQYHKKNWWQFYKNCNETDEYQCNKCNVIINEGERLRHYAEYHYETEVKK